jgi:SAM-dependent methyltransferase
VPAATRPRTYADQTINDPNLLKRWIQRHRLSDALQILHDANEADGFEVLDFGGGDGQLLYQCLEAYPRLRVCLYEPTAGLRRQAEEKLSRSANVQIVADLRDLTGRKFDLIYCLEVFEHLPEKETNEAIAAIHDLTKPRGQVVIGVPHEIFLPALVKGAFRMVRRFGSFDGHPVNVVRAVLGLPPVTRPKKEITPGFFYYRHHVGFDHRNLERSLRRKFEIVSRWFSPVRFLGQVFNSEVYYLLRPGPDQPGTATEHVVS